jgi:hypothetical protein
VRSPSSPGTPNPPRNAPACCPTWTLHELGKHAGIERVFGGVVCFFRLQRPPLTGWSAVAARAGLTHAGVVIVALAADVAGRPDLTRSPKRVLAHPWEGIA